MRSCLPFAAARGETGRPALPVLAALLLAIAALAPLAAQEDRVVLSGPDGAPLRQSDLARGRVVAVVWASWSPRCQDIVPRVNALADRWKDRARVMTINFQEDAPTVRAFLAGRGLKVPVYLDLEARFSKEHAVSTLPGLVVFDQGKVVYRGKLPPDPDGLLKDLLGG